MNRTMILLIAAAMPIAFAAPSFAQEGKTLGVVDNGRTTIEFKAADTSDLPMQQLQVWSQFASEHPNIAHELAYHPSLTRSDSYAKKHPELEQFFSEHPDIRDAMAENPGNFNAIPPRAGE
jgi:hypothetical protein